MNPSEVFVDSSVLVGLNLGDERAKDLVKTVIENGNVLVINPVVYSETSFKVMLTLAFQDGLKGVYDLRKNMEKYSWVYGRIVDSLEALMKAGFLKMVAINWDILKLSAEIGEKYNLLANDAIIAATCKHYGIQKIASFDEDFRNVDFLVVLSEI